MVDIDAHARSRSSRSPELWLFAGLVGLNLFLAWPINMGPLQVGALMEGMKLSSTQAGIVSSVETVVFSLVLVGLPRLPCRVGTRTLGLVGLGGALVGNVLSSQADSFVMICLFRAFVSVNAGIIALASFAALATARRVDRMSAGLTVAVTMLSVAVVVLGGRLSQAGSYPALFLFTAGLALVSAIVAAVLPERRHESGPPLRTATVARSPLTVAAVGLAFGSGAVWAFSERIGVGSGLTVSQVGDVIGTTLVAGLVAGVTALVIARPGRERGLFIISVLGLGLGSITVALASPRPRSGVCSAVISFTVAAEITGSPRQAPSDRSSTSQFARSFAELFMPPAGTAAWSS